jgi:murein DD-endopeptidase MepM/ murein hydrolase activator NlpD
VMLHFEIRKKGKSQDPFIYLPDIWNIYQGME